jgi:hypothetical protein
VHAGSSALASSLRTLSNTGKKLPSPYDKNGHAGPSLPVTGPSASLRTGYAGSSTNRGIWRSVFFWYSA